MDNSVMFNRLKPTPPQQFHYPNSVFADGQPGIRIDYILLPIRQLMDIEGGPRLSCHESFWVTVDEDTDSEFSCVHA